MCQRTIGGFHGCTGGFQRLGWSPGRVLEQDERTNLAHSKHAWAHKVSTEDTRLQFANDRLALL